MTRYTTLLLALFVAAALGGCEKEGPAETTGKKLDNAAEKLGEQMRDATETAGEKIEQAGEKLQDEARK